MATPGFTYQRDCARDVQPEEFGPSDETNAPEALYLDLMERCLTRSLFAEPTGESLRRALDMWSHRLVTAGNLLGELARGRLNRALHAWAQKHLFSHHSSPDQSSAIGAGKRMKGLDWPADAETMIGLQRLDNLRYCITGVIREGVPGDLIETGVWRGGAAIFMRAVLKAYGDTERTVWAADSFRGLPKPEPTRYAADAGDIHWAWKQLAVPLEEVKRNFARYDLLDDQVRFLVGWFRDTLRTAPIERLAVLRLDGDMYESTIDALRYLYSKLSVGGYALVDDYGNVPACKAAVDDHRAEHGITEDIRRIDWTGVFWQRLR